MKAQGVCINLLFHTLFIRSYLFVSDWNSTVLKKSASIQKKFGNCKQSVLTSINDVLLNETGSESFYLPKAVVCKGSYTAYTVSVGV